MYGCSNDDTTTNTATEQQVAKTVHSDGEVVDEDLLSDPNYIVLEVLVFDLFNELNEKSYVQLEKMSEDEAQTLFNPIAESTVELLISHYGFTFAEIEEEFEGRLNDPAIVLLGAAVVTANSAGFDSAKTIRCASEALGLNVFDAVRNLGGEVSKKVRFKQ